MAYKVGKILGSVINLGFYAFLFWDMYNNFKNGTSIALNVIGIFLLLFLREILKGINNLDIVVQYTASEIIQKIYKEEANQNQLDKEFRDLTKDL